MTTHDWTDRLSEYLDGSLTPAERAACEAWLGAHPEGRALLAELAAVKDEARQLADRPVPAEVWSGVLAGIRRAPRARSAPVVSLPARAAQRGARRWAFSPLQLAAAAAVLLALGLGIGVKVRTVVAPEVAQAPGRETPGGGVGTPVGTGRASRAEESYDHAVADLQAVLEQNRATMDTATVRVLESSLAKIDTAIAEAQRALATDPQSRYLNDHLARIKRKKLDLLRQGVALTRAS